MWRLLNYCILVFLIGYHFNIKICFAQKPSTFDCGLWGGNVSPETNEFRFHSDNGFGIGGVAIISNPDINVVPVFWGLISSFPRKSHQEFGTFREKNNPKDIILSTGIGLRTGSLTSNLKFFIEAFLTFNLVDFVAYYDNYTKKVGYLDEKIGYAFGGGIGFQNFAVGYRRIDAGGGSIKFSSFFAEIVIPIWKI